MRKGASYVGNPSKPRSEGGTEAVEASSTGIMAGSESCEGPGLPLAGSAETAETSPGSYNVHDDMKQKP